MRKAIVILLFLAIPTFARVTRPTATNGTNDVRIEADASTGALLTIEYSHHEIHDGRHFFIDGYQFLTDSGDTLLFLFNVNDTTRWPHLIFDFDLNGAASVKMYEDALSSLLPLDTLTTRLTPYNNNRNSSNTSAHDVFWGQTLNDFIDDDSLGTVIWSDSTDTGGGNPNNPNPSHSAGRENEIVLKQNTSYLWEIVTKEADVLVRFKSNWYEHISESQ